MDNMSRVLSVVACVLAGAALAVSLLHAGPRGTQGPPGPHGQTGRDAQVAHLGVCVQTQTSSGVTWVSDLSPAVLMAGVASCPSGAFTSIVPQP